MKSQGLGIGILLFAILLALCSTGLNFIALLTGVVGIVFVFEGFLSKTK
ncbi:hypothetical protein ABE099_20410 [Paenibacillus turicensis]